MSSLIDTIKAKVESVLEKRNWQVDIVLSHTCPLRYEPTEVFLPFIDQSKVDKSTESLARPDRKLVCAISDGTVGTTMLPSRLMICGFCSRIT